MDGEHQQRPPVFELDSLSQVPATFPRCTGCVPRMGFYYHSSKFRSNCIAGDSFPRRFLAALRDSIQLGSTAENISMVLPSAFRSQKYRDTVEDRGFSKALVKF